MKGRGFLIRHGKTLEERYFANATNIFTEREADKILKKGCKPGICKVTRPLYDRVKEKDAGDENAVRRSASLAGA